MKKNIIFTCITSMVIIIAWAAGAHAQTLINYLPGEPALNDRQQHYYEQAMLSRFAQEAVFVTIDFTVFNNSTLTLNLPGGLDFFLQKEERSNVPSGRESWIGREAYSMGAAHFTFKKGSDMLVAQIQFDDVSYVITPLSEGLHALIRYDMSIDEGCLTPSGRFVFEGNSDPPDLSKSPYSSDVILNQQQSLSTPRLATGECNIRVLVAYTDDVDANRPDIYSDIVTMINTANTGYINSGASPGVSLNFSIELAMAYEVAYAETGNINTDLDCITNTTDNCLDDLHTQRTLWDADQVVLLTANGSGLAWVNTAYNQQFSVTGQGNFFAHTFHHELGHNAECTHGLNQTTQTGTAPYAGYGEPGGCFRTVLAYQDECGTGSCPRHNIFSDDDANQWTCNSTSYTPGTTNQRNQDRLVLSRSILVDHEIVSNIVTYGSDYNWFAREAVHFAANSSVGYNSPTNNFELFNGSYGSFRASDQVVLGEGFWARAGCEFDAYLESCTPLRTSGDEEEGQIAEEVKLNDDVFNWNVYPNPLSDYTLIEFMLPEEQNVKMTLFDIKGRLLQTIYDNVSMAEGKHSYNLDASLYEPGIYFLYLTGDKLNESKRLVIQR